MAKLIEVTVEGMNDLTRNIDVLKNTALSAHAAGMASVTIDVANYAKQNHPFQNRTQNLENSIHPLPVEVEKDGVIVGAVKAGMEYAEYVEFGTSKSAPYPYLIPAKEANAKNLLETMEKVQERAMEAIKVTK